MTRDRDVPHPGTRIKTEVIPLGMSVTKAAQLAGVGRPALSNLLNGKASLSADMATRLEKAFGCSRDDLLEMQARYDAAQASEKNAPAEIAAYVPPFLNIKANQIEDWIDHNVSSRARLAVFLRTLVHSTGVDLTQVDFPGNDDAERPGWDGVVEAKEATAWIPVGRSGWEFGVNQNIKTKADHDFEKSVEAINKSKRKELTFIFVTPRRWPGKNAWLEEKREKRLWNDVRVYDASDLEQWVGQSLPAQAWFANENNIPAHDVRSLDRCWADWANVATPPLSGALFNSAIEATRRTILSYLSKAPDHPLIIAADSTDEALAFLAQLFGKGGGEQFAPYRDRVVVFDKPGVLPRLARGAQTFIPVVFTRDVERELAPYAKSLHAIVVYPRSPASTEPHIVLEPANYDAFNSALETMGKDRDEINRLTNESGRSLTVLRRRLATVDAIRKPPWAADQKTATNLIPFLFVGAWHSANPADRSGLELLTDGRAYEELEKEIQSLAQLDDSPVWSIGAYRGIISKIDLLYAIAGFVTRDDLERYFSMARIVLGEDDPALDLEEDRRWAAIYGKTREFSGAFRQGIAETLVLLAVHGNNSFLRRLGIDTEMQSQLVVRDLLKLPLTTRTLEANDRDLPTYAEAAPDEFLSILERDLKTESPASLGLLRPASTEMFARSPGRTGLLWALEGLCWNPQTLPRAVFILAQLAQVRIDDNWVNKPTHSLESVFRAWMPQTSATHEERVSLMKELKERFPNVAWKICVSQFGSYNDIGNFNHKPRWRPDGFGFGEPYTTTGPTMRFQCEMVEMALAWKEQTLDTLIDLVQRLHGLDNAFQDRVWALLETWAKDRASDAEKAEMREKIRVTVLSRRGMIRAQNNDGNAVLTDKAKAVYLALEPSDLLNKHAWLFRDTWVEESADELEDVATVDFQKRIEKIQRMRVDAMREIRDQRGLSALLELSRRGRASLQIGILAASDLLTEAETVELIQLALQSAGTGNNTAYHCKSVVEGALRGLFQNEKRERTLKAIVTNLPEDQSIQLLQLAPFDKVTWKLVDSLNQASQTAYWSDVKPDWISGSDVEQNEGVERLLKANRPRAAFSCVRFHPHKFDAEVLSRLLSAMAAGGDDKPGEYSLEPYHVVQAFKHLDSSPTLTVDQKAGLEFAFLEALAPPWDRRPDSYGIPNLERYVEMHPELFIQAIAWAYKRKDGGEDPVEFQVPQDRVENMAVRGYRLLEAIKRIPGHDDLGELQAANLAKWVATVRQASIEISRLEIADLCIGQMLANAPLGKDGIWPCEAVRQVLEEIQSESMMRGAHTGIYNSRGVHWRGEGGGQERALAEKYRNWGKALQLSYPYVSSKLLMQLALTYDREARREDTDASIRRRLQ